MTLADLIASDFTALLADWGQSVSLRLGGVEVRQITAVFDEAVETWSPGETEVAVLRPALTAATADLAGIDRTHTLITGGVEYRLFGEPRPDGTGLSRAFLTVKK